MACLADAELFAGILQGLVRGTLRRAGVTRRHRANGCLLLNDGPADLPWRRVRSSVSTKARMILESTQPSPIGVTPQNGRQATTSAGNRRLRLWMSLNIAVCRSRCIERVIPIAQHS
jgi:hypothetical protein